MAALKVCYVCGIGPGSSSSTLTCSPIHTAPFSSNQIRRILPRSTGSSSSVLVRAVLSFHFPTPFPFCPLPVTKKATRLSPAMATGNIQEILPAVLDSTSDPPPIFDGTTRLYISYTCPYAQRVWITRNCKGLQDKIKLVPIDLKNRPAWYKEKVYPANKVPALEHNNEVKGESLELIKYIDSNFDGPSLFPDDPAKKEFAEELFTYIDSFYKTVTSSFKGDGNEAGAAFDYIETALSKFEGPFFLGQFSLVDMAYAPFIERFQPFLLEVKKYDITLGRPKLATWIEEMNKNEGYKQTRRDPKELVESYKIRFMAQL